MRQLKSLLAEIGVGQRAAARATGLPVTTINRLCNGQPTPPIGSKTGKSSPRGCNSAALRRKGWRPRWPKPPRGPACFM